jgi:DNA polymerase I-like protein with 3'-5' exonuclease and polymerase domains
VWSRLAFPDVQDIDYGLIQKGMLPGKLLGKQSLKAWGYRLGVLKGVYGEEEEAFDKWTPQLSQYCEQDVKVTGKLLERLEQQEIPEVVLELEHQVQWILARQERHGFNFNLAAAQALEALLLKERLKYTEQIEKDFQPFYGPVKQFSEYCKADNRLADVVPFIPKVNNKKQHYAKDAPCTKVELMEFQPSSSNHIIWLLKKLHNWEPVEFTKKSNEPKIDDEILAALPYEEIKPLARWLTINKRLAQLSEGDKAWLKTYCQETGRMHGAVIGVGAVTRRMAHFAPNMAQIPAVYSPYGHECRALFVASDGMVLVGADADGLEARCLAHFLFKWDQGAYCKTILEGRKEDGTDVHSVNMRALGITDRDTAKTWFYAWMYGAGAKKLAKILKCGVKQAQAASKRFLKNMPAIAKLREAIEKAVKNRGYLRALDGGQLKVRSAHSALNTLLQSAGALVMKKALIILDKGLQQLGLVPGADYEFCANVHDEWQIDSKPEHADTIGKLACDAIRRAGEFYKFNCPLSGSFKVGVNWEETH